MCIDTHKGAFMSRIRRNQHNSIFGGVISGIAHHLNAPVGLLRVVAIVATFLSGGAALGLYALLWWLMPLESREPVEPSVWEERSDGTFSAPFERTYTDRKFLGVAGGLARYWGVDALWTRLALIVTCASVPWLGIGIYLTLAIAMKGPAQKLFNAPFTTVRQKS